MFIMASINSTSSVFMEYENPSRQVVRMESTLDFEIQSSVNETTILTTAHHSDVYYGWVGNLTITYWDVNGSVGIPDANVSSGMWPLLTEVFDLGNGTYFVEVNTTYCWSESLYYLMVEFDKSGFENQFIMFLIHVRSIETDLVVFAPVENQIEEDPTELMIPLGDAIDILFSYNDTEATNDYPRGLEGAQTEGYIGYVIGSTLVQHPIELTENGNGFYKFTFDTTDEWLYLSIRETPISHYYFYFLHVEFTLPNSQPQECLIHVNIIDIPTELVVGPWVEGVSTLFGPGINSIFVSLIDSWPTHSGEAIQNLNITVESSDPSILEVISISNVSTEPGVYNITFNNKGRMECVVRVTLYVEKEGCQSQEWEQRVILFPYGDPPEPPIPWVPIFLVIIAGVLIRRRLNRLEPSEELPENG